MTYKLVGNQSCSMAEEGHSCSKCPKQFSSRSGLLQHQKKEHGMETEGGIKCYENNCEFSCCFMWQLRKHLTQEYDMKMSTEWKEFKSEAGTLVLYHDCT